MRADSLPRPLCATLAYQRTHRNSRELAAWPLPINQLCVLPDGRSFVGYLGELRALAQTRVLAWARSLLSGIARQADLVAARPNYF